MSEPLKQISGWVEDHRVECLDFLRRLIATPSPSGGEGEAAKLVAEEMARLGFTSTRVDRLHNAMGELGGRGGGRVLLLNGHLDHVPPGDMSEPYSGRVMDGSRFGVEGQVVYGRGACDMKAALAAMVLAGGALTGCGLELRGGLRVAAVAQEEVGGAGTKATVVESQFLGDVVVVGEATNMGLALGHRGSLKVDVFVHGRSCHASAPQRGVNALYKAAELVRRIRDELAPGLPEHPLYGKATLVATQVETSPKAANVVPEKCRVTLDCRNHPGFTADDLYHALKDLVSRLAEEDPEFRATVIPSSLVNERRFSGFYTDPGEHPVVGELEEAIAEAYGRPRRGLWTFATDGRIYSRLGIPVVGFGPGEERFAHTEMDHVKVQDFLDTVKVYAWMACKVCGLAGE